VRPEAQGRGLSTALKLFQRRWCLDRGMAVVTWTYDPFLLKNAQLNLGKLRATVRTLLPNFYGVMGGIYASLPTDRFEITWNLADLEVERAAAGAPPLFPLDGPDVPIATSRAIPDGERLALPFPPGAPKTYRSDAERSLKEKRAFRRLATELFARPSNPYTAGLLRSVPDPTDDSHAPLYQIPGLPPDVARLPPGCPFAPRCARAETICREQFPPFVQLTPQHHSLCHFAADLYASGTNAPADRTTASGGRETQ